MPANHSNSEMTVRGNLKLNVVVISLDVVLRSASHWIAAGNCLSGQWIGLLNAECVADSAVSASDGTSFGTDIAVSCCNDNGDGLRKFGDENECQQAKSYEEAKAICEGESGWRLCTLKEMLSRQTKGMGCSHDARYNWVSDECNICEAGTASTAMMARHSTDISGRNVAENDLTPMIVGAAIGAVVISHFYRPLL